MSEVPLDTRSRSKSHFVYVAELGWAQTASDVQAAGGHAGDANVLLDFFDHL